MTAASVGLGEMDVAGSVVAGRASGLHTNAAVVVVAVQKKVSKAVESIEDLNPFTNKLIIISYTYYYKL